MTAAQRLDFSPFDPDNRSWIMRVLSHGPLFSSLSEWDLRRVARASTPVAIKKNSVLMRRGTVVSDLIYLAVGIVTLHRRGPLGHVGLLQGIARGPSIIGDAEWVAGRPWLATGRAYEDSVVVKIPAPVFKWSLQRSPEMALKMYFDSCARNYLANHSEHALALHRVETRMIRLLLDLANCGGESQDGVAILNPIPTNAEMARALGVTRQTVLRTLKQLEASGRIQFRGREVRIARVQDLQDFLPHEFFGLEWKLGGSVRPLVQGRSSDRESAT